MISNGRESCLTLSSCSTRAKVCLAVPCYAPCANATSERLGTVYLAEPICDDIRTTLPLELYVILFDSEHYVTTQGTILSLHQPRFLKDKQTGKKKLKQIEEELKKLMKIRHDNLLSVFAVKLSSAYSERDYPRLSILLEQRPSLSLRDVLEDCDFLREDRALVCCCLPCEYTLPKGLFRRTSVKYSLVSAPCTPRTFCIVGYPRPVFTWPILSKPDNRKSSSSGNLGTSHAFWIYIDRIRLAGTWISMTLELPEDGRCL